MNTTSTAKTKYRLTWRKAIVILLYGISIAFLLWIGKSIIDVWTGNVGADNAIVYLTTENDCVVVGSERTYNYYTITVEDAQGNQWAYYDDEEQPVGTVLRVTWQGNAITNAREAE